MIAAVIPTTIDRSVVCKAPSGQKLEADRLLAELFRLIQYVDPQIVSLFWIKIVDEALQGRLKPPALICINRVDNMIAYLCIVDQHNRTLQDLQAKEGQKLFPSNVLSVHLENPYLWKHCRIAQLCPARLAPASKH